MLAHLIENKTVNILWYWLVMGALKTKDINEHDGCHKPFVIL